MCNNLFPVRHGLIDGELLSKYFFFFSFLGVCQEKIDENELVLRRGEGFIMMV